ncbi:hypothetical protein [Microbispora sp. ATCC PTA-5024]|uniref:hypothetical protein n=1 Tax=Microbispora sp. ATCC PTA-5024 TaxID=316330 RepID=UPI0003DBA77E|nr:hypothetical protein [Microbispora sp. ATCC PTA-5024]ETK36612.1 hypothetical protein MPTA5024_08030 [Microbispora sp. ATCC PTA-5024]
MNAVAWVAVVIVVVLAILAIGYFVSRQNRRRHLQDRFGPEYDRAVRESDSRKAAEQELLAREERHAQLDIRPLAPEARETYTRKWTEVQERFVDAPGFAVTEADALVTAVMADRGYPTDDFEQRLSDLSVAHAATLDHYRQAHDISSRAARQDATTEELRQAMVHYRALFQELLEAGAGDRDDRTTAAGAVPADSVTTDTATADPATADTVNAGRFDDTATADERVTDERVRDDRLRDDQLRDDRAAADRVAAERAAAQRAEDDRADDRTGGRRLDDPVDEDMTTGSVNGRHAARSDSREAGR